VSRVGKRPIPIKSGIEVQIAKNAVTIKGPKGSLTREIPAEMKVELKDSQLSVSRPNNSKPYRSLHGLYRTLLKNMIDGVSSGFERKLEIVGVGYKGEIRKNRLVLQLGYSHPIVFAPPQGIQVAVEGNVNITVTGIDKELVGKVAAKIRSFRPPEPYKGKGIKYADEQIRRKAGKTAA
jgi:large subunit ribosomal protein L6